MTALKKSHPKTNSRNKRRTTAKGSRKSHRKFQRPTDGQPPANGGSNG